MLKGVVDAIKLLKQNNFKIGLASSSPKHMIDALIDHFDLRKYFDEVTSADAVDAGKPHPAVFLHCAEKLGALPHQCVVLEDSVNGLISGKAARMKVIVVPDEQHYNDPRFALADLKLKSLEELDMEMIRSLSGTK